jgi:hypothetical protein
MGRYEESITAYLRAEPTLEAFGDVFLLITTAGEMALAARGLRAYDEARRHLRRGFGLAVEWDSPGQACWLLEVLAGVHAEAGEPARAARLFGSTSHWRESVDAPMPQWDRARYAADVALLGDAVDGPDWEEGRRLSLQAAAAAEFA